MKLNTSLKPWVSHNAMGLQRYGNASASVAHAKEGSASHGHGTSHEPQTLHVVHTTAPRNGFWRVVETMWAIDVMANFFGLLGHAFHGIANVVGDWFN
ncbi:MAG: hypothetical protein ACKO37_09925 [Vampirovibrionales bacterium]